MNAGQRVEVISGVLQGEKATIIPHPKSGQIEDDGMVFIRFDKDGAYLPEKGNTVLDATWFDVTRLRVIEGVLVASGKAYTMEGQYITSGTPLAIWFGGLWIKGTIEFTNAYRFVDSNGGVCGLCDGMKVRLLSSGDDK